MMEFSQTSNPLGFLRRRILSVWFPRLPIDRLLRRAVPAEPLVVVTKADNALRLYALDGRAAKLGLYAGQALADARAMVPQLAVAEADLKADADLLSRIGDACDRFTPFVAIDPPHGLFLDITNCAHLFGGEPAMLASVRETFGRQRLTARVGLADTAQAAFALSRCADGTIAVPGQSLAALAPLPVQALGCDGDIIHALQRAGLKTIGQLASRQRGELASRFGKAFVLRLERALALEDQPISPRLPVPDLVVERRFAEPVTAEPHIIATIRALAESMAALLAGRGQGARVLHAVFFRVDGARQTVAIRTAMPTGDATVLTRLFQTRLDALANPLDPGFGFDLIRLEAHQADNIAQQTIGLGQDSSHALTELIDRLSVRFGADRVLRFIPQNTHIPEMSGVPVAAQSSWHGDGAWMLRRGPAEMPRRPLRLFARPEPVDVVAEVPDGPPIRFTWRHLHHRTRLAAGPETIAMEWWRHGDTAPARDYFRIEDEEGRRYWLFREGGYETGTPRWYLHGVFA